MHFRQFFTLFGITCAGDRMNRREVYTQMRVKATPTSCLILSDKNLYGENEFIANKGIFNSVAHIRRVMDMQRLQNLPEKHLTSYCFALQLNGFDAYVKIDDFGIYTITLCPLLMKTRSLSHAAWVHFRRGQIDIFCATLTSACLLHFPRIMQQNKTSKMCNEFPNHVIVLQTVLKAEKKIQKIISPFFSTTWFIVSDLKFNYTILN
ncbi:hypothetical protein EGR_00790 [Echinococcus granulosus]|uniref:Uncharacterized protein n=1 Tax=Echinococcus granulosus TaxID=6210 RepID=W6UUB2_ECHGR|nr:hypothetical protein EGR_00790 [Echinococcus granulosus]EUB64246.1 hypothetical protein EGR_00790 [Echinococcus granulosus]